MIASNSNDPTRNNKVLKLALPDTGIIIMCV